MRIKLTITLILMSAAASAQWNYPITAQWVNKFKVDKIFWLNTSDTTGYSAALYPGALVYQQMVGDTSIYFSTGLKYEKVGKYLDTTSLSTRINAKADTLRLNDSLAVQTLEMVTSKGNTTPYDIYMDYPSQGRYRLNVSNNLQNRFYSQASTGSAFRPMWIGAGGVVISDRGGSLVSDDGVNALQVRGTGWFQGTVAGSDATASNQFVTLGQAQSLFSQTVVADARYSYKSISFTAIDTLHAFGDSYTEGVCATPGKRYISIFNQRMGTTLVDNSLSSMGVYYAAKKANENILANNQRAVTVLVGLNDIRRGGSDPRTLQKLKAGLTSIVVNAFADSIFPANSTRITQSGTWDEEPNYNGGQIGDKASYIGGSTLATNGTGNTLTFEFTGDEVAIGLFAYDSVNNYTSPVAFNVDGEQVYVYNGNQKTDGLPDGLYNNRITPNAIYLSGLGSGAHTLVIETLNFNTVIIDYIATFKSPQKCPPVIIGLIPKLTVAGYALSPNLASAALLDKGDSIINEVVSVFRQRPIAVAYTNEYYDTTTDVCNDDIHPNDLGQYHIAEAFSAAVSTSVKAPTLQQLTADAGPITNNIALDGSVVSFTSNGAAPPSTSIISPGTKVLLWPRSSTPQADFAIGIDSFVYWHSVPANSNFTYKWYGGTTEFMRLNNLGLAVSTPASFKNLATVSQVVGADTYSIDVKGAEVNAKFNGAASRLNLNFNGGPVSIVGILEVGGVKWITGTGSPEGAITAPVGSIYSNKSGGAGTTLYIKESGAGNTGWIAK